MANILDKAIAAIDPEKGYRRAVARSAPVSYTHLFRLVVRLASCGFSLTVDGYEVKPLSADL